MKAEAVEPMLGSSGAGTRPSSRPESEADLS